MANGFTIVTNRDNTFFTNNKMTVGSGIPTSGSYKIGDIVISDSQADGVFGWVCTQAGNPGNWEVIGSGAGGGNSVLVEYSNVVEFTDARTSIDIGIPEYNKETDSLEVHYNGLLLAQDIHYSINETGTAITNLNGSWNANADDTQAMIFVVRKSTAGLNVIPMRNIVDINNATMEVDPGIKINLSTDIVSVHLNGVLLMKDVDYRIENGKLIKVDQTEAWNPYNVVGQKMFIDVLRNKGSLNEPDLGSVTKEHLSDELANEITNNTNSINSLTEIANSHTSLINNLTTQIENVDFSEVEAKIGDLPTLQTTAKNSLVDAVNELFQNANNGKELIATAIGEPLVSTDTFSAMSNGINNLNSQFKSALMNNGVSIESTDKFKQLIEKLALLAGSEGKGIQFAEGVFSNDSMGWVTNNTTRDYTFFEPLNFVPTHLFIVLKEFNVEGNNGGIYNIIASNVDNLQYYSSGYRDHVSITNISTTGFSVTYNNLFYTGGMKWYAIGVGEEDTTLRDSLASILQDEGVSVTTGDNLASLITKVDDEFDNKNRKIESNKINIITASELPSTVVNNQVVLLNKSETSLPIVLTDRFNANPSTNTEINVATVNTANDFNFNQTINNIKISYYLEAAIQNVNNKIVPLDGYLGVNNTWKQFSKNGIIFYMNGVDSENISGASSLNSNDIYTGYYINTVNSNNVLNINTNIMAQVITAYVAYKKPYNLTDYNTLEITYSKGNFSLNYFHFGFSTSYEFDKAGNMVKYINVDKVPTDIVTKTVDISSLTGTHYFVIRGRASISESYDLNIHSIKLY